MGFPLEQKIIAVYKAVQAKFPIEPFTEEGRRAWNWKAVQQVVFQFPNEGWGTKRADSGRPLSKDALAVVRPDGQLWAYDMVNGSTGRVYDAVGGEAIPNQVFVSVPPFNHLGGEVVTPPAPDNPPQPPPGPAPDYVLRQEFEAMRDSFQKRLDALNLETILNAVVEQVQVAGNKTDNTGVSYLKHAHTVPPIFLQRAPPRKP